MFKLVAPMLLNLFIALGITVFSMVPAGAQQVYPNRPIRLIVPGGAGGNLDLVSRLVANRMSTILGQQVVVENKVGANGNIGVGQVVNSAPDGYTLGTASAAMLTINQHLYSMNFDPLRDLTPITIMATGAEVLVVRPELGVRSMAELIERAKANPGKLDGGSAGAGSLMHLSLELMKLKTGTNITHVPYKSGESLNALLAGNIHMMVDTVSTSLPHIRAGKLIPLAVTSRNRVAELPDVPTFQEAGVKDYVAEAWLALIGPPKLPKNIVDTIHAAALKALADPELKATLASMTNTPVGNTQARLAEQMRTESVRWREIVQSASIKID